MQRLHYLLLLAFVTIIALESPIPIAEASSEASLRRKNEKWTVPRIPFMASRYVRDSTTTAIPTAATTTTMTMTPTTILTSLSLRSSHRQRDRHHHQQQKQNQQQKQTMNGSNIRAGAIMTPASTTAAAAASVVSKIPPPLSYYLRVALAGGVAGATGTAVLYPMDSAKTLRQSNPNMYSSVRDALMKLIRSSNNNSWHISHAYRGIVPAALGAIPSSALYFGAYESSKMALSGIFLNNNDNDNQQQSSSSTTTTRRLLVHGLAAACGNTISSAVFVPKEVIKQQLQYHAASAAATTSAQASSQSVGKVLMNILQEKGIRGLYVGYQATLMRNIPSAMLKFVLFEEFKRKFDTPNPNPTTTPNSFLDGQQQQHAVLLSISNIPQPVRVFAAGAVAGALASGFMTPIDVLKTRLATGTCPAVGGMKNCFLHVAKESGWKGLYAGAGSRMMWSGAFSAIGFGTFELVKQTLGVADINNNNNSNSNNNMIDNNNYNKDNKNMSNSNINSNSKKRNVNNFVVNNRK